VEERERIIEVGLRSPLETQSERLGETGQTLPEYALILALISVALISALTFLSQQISGLFSTIGSAL
jgi:Flp pilus assembly pilin Flp